MRKYYTRVCNFFYGSNSKLLVKKKLTLPLNGNNLISFDKIELFIRYNNKVKSKIIHLSDIRNLTPKIKKKFFKTYKKLQLKKSLLTKNLI